MSLVEDAYQQAIATMTPAEKLARVESFLAWTRNLLARQVRSKSGPRLSDERVRWEVALRMYESDPQLAPLLREQVARVPT